MEEIIDICDENDRPIARMAKDEFHALAWSGQARGLYNRHAYVFLFNSDNQMLIQLRHPRRDDGGLWDKSVGGHVAAGEDYLDAIGREINEEIRHLLPPLPLEVFTDHSAKGRSFHDRETTIFIQQLGKEVGFVSRRRIADQGLVTEGVHAAIYLGYYDGPIRIRPDEVEDYRWVDRATLDSWLDREPESFTHDLQDLYERYRRRLFLPAL